MKEIMSFFKDFLGYDIQFGEKSKSLFSLFIYFFIIIINLVLVSKKIGIADLKDFRLIILVDSLYKILPKVLTTRLKEVMGMAGYLFLKFFCSRKIISGCNLDG